MSGEPNSKFELPSYYQIISLCSNCGWRGLMKYDKGCQVPKFDYCPLCNCREVRKSYDPQAS